MKNMTSFLDERPLSIDKNPTVLYTIRISHLDILNKNVISFTHLLNLFLNPREARSR